MQPAACISGFQQRMEEVQAPCQLLGVQPLKKGLFKGGSEEYLPEHRSRFIHIHILPDFPAFLRLLDGGFPKLEVLLEYGGYLFLHVGIVQPYLHQQVVVVEVEAAPVGIVPVVQQAHEPLHRVLHSGYIPVDKF